MVEALLSGGNTTLKVLVAAIAVVVLLAVAFWVLRRFGSGRLRRGRGDCARARRARRGVRVAAAAGGRPGRARWPRARRPARAGGRRPAAGGERQVISSNDQAPAELARRLKRGSIRVVSGQVG